MCGVAGIFGGDWHPRERRAHLEKMLACIQHRGPDAWGTYATPQIGLGHVRLSIIDVAEGHQPMVADHYALSFNGEIFNYLEIREELEREGLVFKTQSDTEVLLRSLAHWGLKALEKFNGQFAFLFWDAARQILLAARDRFGVRPLFYRQWEGTLWFTSEIKAFDAVPGLGRNLNPSALVEHGLFWNTLNDRTVYQDVHSIEPGTGVIFRPEQPPYVVRFYELGSSFRGVVPHNIESAQAELVSRLSQAVSLRLRSDVPVGAYLSGGIDSSAISLLTDKLCTDRFKTFSIAFADPQFDESHFQLLAADRLKTDRFSRCIKYADIEKNFEKAIWHGERPVFRTAPVPLLLLAQHVRQSEIRVVLTGEGADEILWGYDAFKELKLLQFWSKQPHSRLRPQLIRTLYPHLAHYSNSKQFGLMRMFYEGFLDSYNNALLGLNMRVHNNRAVVNYLRSDLRFPVDNNYLTNHIEAILPSSWSQWSTLQKHQFLEMRTLLDGYLLSSQGDRMSLAYGIEGRFPFLDHTVVDWAFHLPDRLKMPMLSQKHLLRQAFRPHLPPGIVDRPKQPYQAPDLKAFFSKGKLGAMASDYLSPASIASAGIFEPRMVDRFLVKFAKGAPENVGYRDNMLFCFMLSTQLIAHHCRHPRINQCTPTSLRTINILVE